MSLPCFFTLFIPDRVVAATELLIILTSNSDGPVKHQIYKKQLAMEHTLQIWERRTCIERGVGFSVLIILAGGRPQD